MSVAEQIRRCATTLVAVILVFMAIASAPQWQPRLGEWTERVTGLEELEQSLMVLLITPLGSVPGRPTFGTKLYEYVDAPLDDLQVFVPREVISAVRQWEPRIAVDRVSIVASSSGTFEAEVRWTPTRASGLLEQPKTTRVTL